MITLDLLLEMKVNFVFRVPQQRSLHIEVVHGKTEVLCREVSNGQGQFHRHFHC